MTSYSTLEYSKKNYKIDIENMVFEERDYYFEKFIETSVGDKETDFPKCISQLKKQIKHCKNHIERINLERKLNEAYRKRKRK